MVAEKAVWAQKYFSQQEKIEMKSNKISILLAIASLVISMFACMPKADEPDYSASLQTDTEWVLKATLTKVDDANTMGYFSLNVQEGQLPASISVQVGTTNYIVIPNLQDFFSATLAEFAFSEVTIGNDVYVYDRADPMSESGSFTYYFKLKEE